MAEKVMQTWTRDEGAARAKALFEKSFGAQPQGVWSAPGRVNLIGEHTDYNGGLCLPIALPQRTYAAVSPREDSVCRLVSGQVDGIAEIDLDKVGPHDSENKVDGWGSYVVGVLWALREAGCEGVRGIDVAIDSCVPFGAGLSSSAALEASVGVAVSDLFGLKLADDDEGRKKLAAACVRAENAIAGANTGGLDQAASLRCQEGCALLLDCRTGAVEPVPFDLKAEGLALLVIDTCAPHSLTDGQYGQRRATCEAAAAKLGLDLLAEVTDRDEALGKLDDELQIKRARHVIDEIWRTRRTVEVLRSGTLEGERLAEVAKLFDASHDSLRDDYEVTCPELDTAVDTARAQGSHGARMTGGGFGGSAIAIVDADKVEQTRKAIAAAYEEAGFAAPAFGVAVPAAPAGRDI